MAGLTGGESLLGTIAGLLGAAPPTARDGLLPSDGRKGPLDGSRVKLLKAESDEPVVPTPVGGVDTRGCERFPNGAGTASIPARARGMVAKAPPCDDSLPAENRGLLEGPLSTPAPAEYLNGWSPGTPELMTPPVARPPPSDRAARWPWADVAPTANSRHAPIPIQSLAQAFTRGDILWVFMAYP
jgi:hypothetical protein